MSLIERLDRFQRGHPRVGLPLAVLYKFFDDQGTYLAALVAYYGLLAVVPLLLLATTVLGYVLHGNPGLQTKLVDSALSQFPVVGSQLTDPRGVSGSGLGLAVGIFGTLFFGLGVAQAAQNAMNTIWRVPRNSRPNPFTSRLRSLVILGIFGLAVIGTTALTAVASALPGIGAISQVFIGIGTLLLNAAVFSTLFRVATARALTLGEIVPGAVGAAAVWYALQYVGTLYVQHAVRNATEVNSIFAVLLGLIVWIFLGTLVAVFAVEFNTVRTLKLYPRALLTPFTDSVDLTAADERSYTLQAQAQRQKGFQEIDVHFEQLRPDDAD